MDNLSSRSVGCDSMPTRMTSPRLRSLLLLLGLATALLLRPMVAAAPAKHTFAIGSDAFLLDGQPFEIRCGEIHAARVPREYWRHRLQLARAMGLNTVCAYLFWNMQQPAPDTFDWSGQADVAEFCRIAQQEGLWVILRPGPYACAEWEMGGLPWWLLKNHDVQLRSRDPAFLEPARRYLHEVGRVLGPLQITHGGPILMVQAENEYGFYGRDQEYMGAVRQALLDAGFDVPLFACNPTSQLKPTYRSDLFPVVNFGADPVGAFKALREILPHGPLMCGEFYPGWFDTWGAPHHLGKTDAYLRDLGTMLEMHASFSIYMAHGGTTFGLWAGADRPFKPDTSSYDYDAPISEAGWATPKFFQTRELIAKYLAPGEGLPPPPAPNPTTHFASVTLAECAPILANLPEPIADALPRTMEDYNQGYGAILYRTQLPAGPAGRIEAAAIHDFGYVFLDGRRIAITDRRTGHYGFDVPERKTRAQLDLLVEPMGRVNFGREVHDRKGIHGPVTFRSGQAPAAELRGWKIYSLPLDAKMLAGLRYGAAQPGMPAFWRGSFQVEKPADVFVDLTNCGKGVVWVNGHCLARYWNIGPTQTAYLPGPWVKPGANEIVVLDYLSTAVPTVSGRDTPILSRLRPALDFTHRTRAVGKLNLPEPEKIVAAAFAPGSAAQDVKFEHPVKGRFFALQSESAFDGKPYAAIAELTLLDAAGRPLNSEGWSIAYVDSEEMAKEDGTAENAIDGQIANYWHTQWSDAAPAHPHTLVLDLVRPTEVAGFRYTPRQGDDRVTGRIRDYRVYIGDDLVRAK